VNRTPESRFIAHNQTATVHPLRLLVSFFAPLRELYFSQRRKDET